MKAPNIVWAIGLHWMLPCRRSLLDIFGLNGGEEFFDSRSWSGGEMAARGAPRVLVENDDSWPHSNGGGIENFEDICRACRTDEAPTRYCSSTRQHELWRAVGCSNNKYREYREAFGLVVLARGSNWNPGLLCKFWSGTSFFPPPNALSLYNVCLTAAAMGCNRRWVSARRGSQCGSA